jgi:hypothetical protein
MSKELLDFQKKADQKIGRINQILAKYAQSGEIFGMTKMAEDLWQVQEDLLKMQEDLHEVTGLVVHNGLVEAQQHSMNVLNAALAGIEI